MVGDRSRSPAPAGASIVVQLPPPSTDRYRRPSKVASTVVASSASIAVARRLLCPPRSGRPAAEPAANENVVAAVRGPADAAEPAGLTGQHEHRRRVGEAEVVGATPPVPVGEALRFPTRAPVAGDDQVRGIEPGQHQLPGGERVHVHAARHETREAGACVPTEAQWRARDIAPRLPTIVGSQDVLAASGEDAIDVGGIDLQDRHRRCGRERRVGFGRAVEHRRPGTTGGPCSGRRRERRSSHRTRAALADHPGRRRSPAAPSHRRPPTPHSTSPRSSHRRPTTQPQRVRWR